MREIETETRRAREKQGEGERERERDWARAQVVGPTTHKRERRAREANRTTHQADPPKTKTRDTPGVRGPELGPRD